MTSKAMKLISGKHASALLLGILIQSFSVQISKAEVSDGFDFPVCKPTATVADDSVDDCHVSIAFGEKSGSDKDHLGDDWNGKGGRNADLGDAVFSVSNGTIVYARNAGQTWGNVVIIQHDLPDGSSVKSLYGHLDQILKTTGTTVDRGEQIGTIGRGLNNEYTAHLHFEIRTDITLGVERGYGFDPTGWVNSTDFIMANRNLESVPPPTDYTLELSGVSNREHMQDWDSNWISEYEEEFAGYEWQVDPGNGGQVGVWTGSGNPSNSPGSNRDYSQFIAAGPPAGTAVTVRMKFEHRDDGSWVSCSHSGDSNMNRAHYEVALQSGAFRIYKFWGPDPGGDYASVASTSFTAQQGAVYWIYLTETRVGNAVNGAVTIDGELLDTNLNSLATISVTDTGNLGGRPIINSSNKRGFGSYSAADGNGAKIFEWSVGAAD